MSSLVGVVFVVVVVVHSFYLLFIFFFSIFLLLSMNMHLVSCGVFLFNSSIVIIEPQSMCAPL